MAYIDYLNKARTILEQKYKETGRGYNDYHVEMLADDLIKKGS